MSYVSYHRDIETLTMDQAHKMKNMAVQHELALNRMVNEHQEMKGRCEQQLKINDNLQSQIEIWKELHISAKKAADSKQKTVTESNAKYVAFSYGIMINL